MLRKVYSQARGYGNGNQTSCEYGTVVQNTTTATYNGYPIGFVEATCPLYCEGAPYAKRNGGYSYCTEEYCVYYSDLSFFWLASGN
jgi:hypothetical protein